MFASPLRRPAKPPQPGPHFLQGLGIPRPRGCMLPATVGRSAPCPHTGAMNSNPPPADCAPTALRTSGGGHYSSCAARSSAKVRCSPANDGGRACGAYPGGAPGRICAVSRKYHVFWNVPVAGRVNQYVQRRADGVAGRGRFERGLPMCQTCGCSPCKVCGRKIEDKVCSGCGKASSECTCKPSEK